MKNLKILISSLCLFTLVFQSCEDQEEVTAPNFTISQETVVAKAGEPVEFAVNEAPDFLMFYSGEFGHEYQHRERTNAEGAVTMSFKNVQKYGLGTSAIGTLTVLTSTNYDGSGTPEAVASATWTDISSRFNISEDYTFTPWTESGIIDIADLETGEPIYFAFRFFASGHKNDGNRQPEWRLDDFEIELAAEGAPAPLTVADMDAPGWNTVDVEGVVPAWNTSKWYYTNGYWRFRGGPATYANEDWLITNPISLTKVAPDKGQALKTYSDKLESFSHVFSEAGTYTLTFVGNNTTIHGSEENIQEITVVVQE